MGTEHKIKDFEKILNIGISLSTDRSPEHILETILDSGMDITGCDAGTLYLLREGRLMFRIMKTKSMGVSKGADGKSIEDMPPVSMEEENVCAYAAIHREAVNIPDVYHSTSFDFSGPRRYDALTGYRTVSMLVIPIVDMHQELIGVLQMINAMDGEGRVIPFEERFEIILRSLSSLAAIELTNLEYLNEIKIQMRSFVEAMATAIDERTPYNGTHTRKVAGYVLKLADYINHRHELGECEKHFTETELEQLELAALSHDIGKLIIPLSVMNRASRLDGGLERIQDRFELFKAWYELDLLKGLMDRRAYESAVAGLDEFYKFLSGADRAEYLSDEDLERVRTISERFYEGVSGKKLPYLTEEERIALSVRKGTLTDEARARMQEHAQMTAKILSKVHFNRNYRMIPVWAANHHEHLDGSGYPQHLAGDEIDMETRMITVADIYDALTSKDRPYKKPMTAEKAFFVLRQMALEGKLEERLVNWFEEAIGGKRK